MKESLHLARIYVDVSEDPILDNNQMFMISILDRISRITTQASWKEHPCGYDMLRKHRSRVQKDVIHFARIMVNI